MAVIKSELLKLAAVVTPNVPEAEILAGFPIGSLVRLPGAPPLVAPPVLPRMLELSAAPVPASTHTVLRWSLPAAAHVWLDVLDVQGRRVAEPFAGPLLAAGEGSFTLRTHGWSPGVYLVRLQAGAAIATRRIVVNE